MRRARAGAALVSIIIATTLVGCSAPFSVEFVDRAAAYDTPKLQALVDDTSVPGYVSARTKDEAEGLRHEALVQLRSKGGAASTAADLITRTFPATTQSIPIYVERADFRGVRSLIIVEAWSGVDGKLTSKRLWVLDAESGQVSYSASAPSR